MITFDNVTKRFMEDAALDAVSFLVEPGEFVFVTGPSGSGKTSIMRLLTGEYLPDEGEILFEDVDVRQLAKKGIHHHRRQIGVVFQDYKLLPELNVWENIALPLSIIGKSQDETVERVTDLLNLIQLPNKAHMFPVQLSGGEAQRISIARALAAAPKVIFADEPTGNLDPETSGQIAKLLHKINQLGTTILFATHDPVVLEMFDKERRLDLKQGKLIKDSHPKSLYKSKSDDDEESDHAHSRRKKSKSKNKSEKSNQSAEKDNEKEKDKKDDDKS